MIRKPVVGSDVRIDELQSEEDATQGNTCSAVTEEDMESVYLRIGWNEFCVGWHQEKNILHR